MAARKRKISGKKEKKTSGRRMCLLPDLNAWLFAEEWWRGFHITE
jgi:hypothetical protein